MVRMTKILLVDDSKFLRLATERALTRAGYGVSTASDGEHALAVAREQKPDLILLDMLLPKMTGPDVLKALKKDPATAGIAVAKDRGVYCGRKKGSTKAKPTRAQELRDQGLTVPEIANALAVSDRTVFRYLSGSFSSPQ